MVLFLLLLPTPSSIIPVNPLVAAAVVANNVDAGVELRRAIDGYVVATSGRNRAAGAADCVGIFFHVYRRPAQNHHHHHRALNMTPFVFLLAARDYCEAL